nr:FAD-dependent oxidoreductase [Mesorhizobium sp.]
MDPGSAHRDGAEAAANRDRQWRNRGADVRLLSQTEIRALTGAQGYLGGWLDRRAGVIDPLAYTSELARIASAAGVKIAEHQKVVRLDKNAGLWRISTEGGAELQAKAVILATNAYTGDLLPGLAETIVPLHSSRSRQRRCRPIWRPGFCRRGRRYRIRAASSFTTARVPTGGWCLAGAAGWRCRPAKVTGRISSARCSGSIPRYPASASKSAGLAGWR